MNAQAIRNFATLAERTGYINISPDRETLAKAVARELHRRGVAFQFHPLPDTFLIMVAE